MAWFEDYFDEEYLRRYAARFTLERSGEHDLLQARLVLLCHKTRPLDDDRTKGIREDE